MHSLYDEQEKQGLLFQKLQRETPHTVKVEPGAE